MLITFSYKDGSETVRFEDILTAGDAEEKSLRLRSNESPVGLLSNRTVLRQQGGGAKPRQARICPVLLDQRLRQIRKELAEPFCMQKTTR